MNSKQDKGKSWFLYLLECKDGSYYTGITTNLKKRIKKHQEGKGSKYVYARGFKRVLASKSFKNRSEASKKEYIVKQLPREQKIEWFD